MVKFNNLTLKKTYETGLEETHTYIDTYVRTYVPHTPTVFQCGVLTFNMNFYLIVSQSTLLSIVHQKQSPLFPDTRTE